MKNLKELNKINLIFLELSNCNAEETLSVLFDLSQAKKSITEDNSICYEFSKMNVWLEKEPVDNPEAEKRLCEKLKKRKWNGKYWCEQVIVLQKLGTDTFAQSMEFLWKKIVPLFGHRAVERLAFGLQVEKVQLHEKDWDSISFTRLRKKIGKRMLATEKLFQNQLKNLTGKVFFVVAYAAPTLILNPKNYLGIPFNLECLYEAVLVQLPPMKEEKFTEYLSSEQTNRIYYYEEPGRMSEWTMQYLKKFGKMLHRWERWYAE